MAELNYNFSSIYIILLAILYKTLTLDFSYFSTLFGNILQFNNLSVFFIINIIALGIILTKLKFQINIKIGLE